MSSDIQEEAKRAIPVTVLTGFLGAGKTTLLNHLLESPVLSDAAVLINEFGDVAIDHLLVRQLSDDVILLDSGCLCCTVRGDLVEALRDLFVKRVKNDIPEFSRIIIETTGLADPAPIIHTLMTDAMLATHYRLDGIICSVDAVNGSGNLDNNPESVKQVAVADRLLLTKLDIAKPEDVEKLRRRLHLLNPSAEIIPVANGIVDPNRILNCGLFDGSKRIPDVARWLNEEAYEDDKHRHHHHHGDDCACGCHDEDQHHHGEDCCCHDKDHHHHGEDCACGHHDDDHHHHHDEATSHHDKSISSFVITFDQPVPWAALLMTLEFLIATRGENLLRVKGIVNAIGQDKPLIVHGVQHLFHEVVTLPEWPDDDHRTRIVFITRDIPKDALEGLLRHAMEESWEDLGIIPPGIEE